MAFDVQEERANISALCANFSYGIDARIRLWYAEANVRTGGKDGNLGGMQDGKEICA